MARGKAASFKLEENDLLSEVNAKLARANDLEQFSGETEDHFFAWVFRVIHNCAINVKRVEGKRTENHFSTNDNPYVADHSPRHHVHQNDGGQKQLLSEIIKWAKDFCDDKKPHFHQIFNLYFEEEHKYEEIAMEVGCPLGTVKTTIYAIRQQIIKNFGQQYAEALEH